LTESDALSSQAGYDRAAELYDEWAWQQFWRKNEFPLVLQQLLAARPSLGLIDLGVGTGAFLALLRDKLSTPLPLAGVDVSAAMLEKARDRLGERALLIQGDVRCGLPFRDGTFDAAVMMRIANHISDLEGAMVEVARILAPRGILIATDIAAEHDYMSTRVPTLEGTVAIETYKHSRADWEIALRIASLSLRTYELYTFTDLLERPTDDFKRKFDTSGTTPIFQIIVAAR
jgi:ubiquinone/menaquinone biosynthesis C-methylase UbiE